VEDLQDLIIVVASVCAVLKTLESCSNCRSGHYIVIHSLHFLRLFQIVTCSATSLNHPFKKQEQSPFHYYFQISHVFWPQRKVTTALSLPSFLLLAALVRNNWFVWLEHFFGKPKSSFWMRPQQQ